MLFDPGESFDEEELQLAQVGVADPVGLMVAVQLLAAGGDQEAADRLMWFAVRRTAAVNLALDVAQRYTAGWFSAGHFDSRMRAVSPLAIDSDGGHGHGSGAPAGGAHGHDDDHDHGSESGHHGETGHGEAGHAHHEGCACLDHEPLTSAIYRWWRRLLSAARDEAGVTTFPATDEISLYERVLDRADERAGRRPSVPSTASPVTVPELPEPVTDDAPTATARLTLTPCASTVTVGEPINLFVRLEGVAEATAVVVQGTNAEPVTVTVKPRERDAFVDAQAGA